MKMLYIAGLVLAIMVAAYLVRSAFQPEQQSVVERNEVSSLEALPKTTESWAQPEPLQEAAPESITVHQPVQPIEERGDAMLFEIDALQGTPFDQAVTQPFEE